MLGSKKYNNITNTEEWWADDLEVGNWEPISGSTRREGIVLERRYAEDTLELDNEIECHHQEKKKEIKEKKKKKRKRVTSLID